MPAAKSQSVMPLPRQRQKKAVNWTMQVTERSPVRAQIAEMVSRLLVLLPDPRSGLNARRRPGVVAGGRPVGNRQAEA